MKHYIKDYYSSKKKSHSKDFILGCINDRHKVRTLSDTINDIVSGIILVFVFALSVYFLIGLGIIN